MRIAPLIAALGLFLVGAPAGTIALGGLVYAVTGGGNAGLEAAADTPNEAAATPLAPPPSDAPPQAHLAHIIRSELYRDSRCPAEPQAEAVLERVTAGWDFDAVAAALQIAASEQGVCAPVAAALGRWRDSAQLAGRAAGEDGNPTTIGGTGVPGGDGGPLYRGS